MLRFSVALLLFVLTARGQTPVPQQDIDNALAQAEALYFEARFAESLAMVAPIDVALKQEPARIKERVRIKIQMALAYVGLNETDNAKAQFQEVCGLDPSFELDRDLFASKVLSLFDEAKADQTATRCQTVCGEVNRLLDVGENEAIFQLLSSEDSGCPCVQAAALDAAEHAYQKGLDSYRRNEFPEALQSLRVALKLQPDNELARQYVELTERQLRLTTDRLLLDWRLHFERREFPQAAQSYRDLVSADTEGVAGPALDQIRTEYRTLLSSMAESWTRACTISDVLAAETRRQAMELMPEPSMGTDILDQMGTCPVKSCLKVSSQLARVRLKTQVQPEVPRGAVTNRVTIQTSIRIDENGDVEVNSVEGGSPVVNAAVRTALQQWKFAPAIVQDEPRCVETEIPIVLLP
jgi:Tfp pilus assembly protein PilF